MLSDDLSAIERTLDISCAWHCLPGGLQHCLPVEQLRKSSAKSVIHGIEWEGDCKRLLRTQFQSNVSLNGTVAAVAGLFFGDWLAPLSAVVGPAGAVYGFEPTPFVSHARATALANRVHNVHVRRACLSNNESAAPLRMCVDGGYSAVVGDKHSCSHGYLESVKCHTLDAVLPWRSRRVGLLLLDVEGYENTALEGAVSLIERWQPLLLLELNDEHGRSRGLERLAVYKANDALKPYRLLAECSGLKFYGVATGSPDRKRK